jgi:hypothetical protein
LLSSARTVEARMVAAKTAMLEVMIVFMIRSF